jgi:hypothetical protein
MRDATKRAVLMLRQAAFMKIDLVYLTVMAKSHAQLVAWWTAALGREFDRIPVPNCREWDLTPNVVFQVIDGPDRSRPTDVSLHVENVDQERHRIVAAGILVPEPEIVPGFASLRLTQISDPEGNKLSLLSGQ